jgi:hypothetical protein
MHARSDGQTAPPASSRRSLKTREEIMSSIWLSPALKPKSVIQLGQKTIISTRNIIFGCCPQTKKEHKSAVTRMQRDSSWPQRGAKEARTALTARCDEAAAAEKFQMERQTNAAGAQDVCPQITHRRKMIHRAEACRNKALKCERAALIATDPKAQAAYRVMARQWRETAEQAEALDRRQTARGKTP